MGWLISLNSLLLCMILTKPSMNVQVYKPSNGESLWQLIASIFSGLIQGHSLGFRLFLRDLRAGLEASLLGYSWTLLPALASAGLWIFLNDQRVIKVTDTGMAYPAFVLIGTTCWTLFAEGVNKPIQRYKGAMSMMVKLNFPRESLTIAALYDMLFSMSLKLIVLIGLLLLLDTPIHWSWFGLVPVLVGAIFTGIAIGLFLAPFGILFNDISRGLNVVLPFLMYLSPVVFNVNPESFLGKIQVFNPISSLIHHARWFVGSTPIHFASALWLWLGVAMLLFIAGLVMLRIALPIIVERSGS